MSRPKGIPNPAKGTKQPHIVDKVNSRLTVPGRNGKQWPILMGHGATGVLMYVALHPGCKWKEIAETLGLASSITLNGRMRRLRKAGLVTMLRNRYQINPVIKAHIRVQLVSFLRALGVAHGMSPGEQTKTITGEYVWAKDRIELPEDLFLSRHRTRVLAFIALVGETYRYEIVDVLGVEMRYAPVLLYGLLQEGVLRRRVVKGARLYSLDPTYPGAGHLDLVLRYMGRRTDSIREAVNYAFIRRHQTKLKGNKKQISIINAMKVPDLNAPHGIRMDIGLHAARLANRTEPAQPVWGKTSPTYKRRRSPKNTSRLRDSSSDSGSNDAAPAAQSG